MRLLLPVLALAGCKSMAILGQATDSGGHPMAGATVTAVGTLCQTQTDESGAFVLPCPPGRYTVVVSKEGFHSSQVTVNATERQGYDVGALELVAIPGSTGLYRMVGADFLRFDRGWLGRTADDAHKAFCLRPDESPSNEVPGDLVLYDRAADDWKLMRLDEEGCAQRLEWRAGTWRVTYQDAPESGERQLGDDTLHTFDLAPGRYFLADWPSGRFRPDASRSPEEEKRFSGYYLVVP